MIDLESYLPWKSPRTRGGMLLDIDQITPHILALYFVDAGIIGGLKRQAESLQVRRPGRSRHFVSLFRSKW